MVCDRRKFPKAEMLPLTREEMISLLKGNGTPRVGVACGNWLHIDELALQDQKPVEDLLERFPEDMQVFYLKKPKLFAEDGDRYTWCDVAGADPSIGRKEIVGVDEEHALDWEVIRRISEHLPDAEEATMYCNAPVEDGRDRLAWFSDGPWTRLWDYRGMTNSLMDLYTNPEDVHHVCRRVVDFFKRAAKRGVEEAHIDGIAFGDDLGMQKGPFMSPEMFREFYYPYYVELCEYAHSLGLHVWLHSCGDVRKLLPDIIKSGIDVLHPIQKYAMEEQEIADTFGNHISFWAGIDLQRVLPFGSVEEVREETRHFIDVFHQRGKGRMVFTLNNRMQDNVPIENFIAFIEEAHRYGAAIEGVKENE